MTDSPEEEAALEMDLEAYREDMKMEDPHKYYTMYAVVRSRCKQLIEGRGGIMEMKQTIADKEKRIEQLEAQCNGAYTERNRLVALIASLFPSGIKKTAIPGWDEAWHGCVYIDLPNGQASWHYHDSEAYLFAHLPPYQGKWDGHTTDEKYDRIARLVMETKND